MNSSTQNPTPSPSKTTGPFSGNALLSLTTIPLLCGLAAGKGISDALREIGLFSEELFRGDRLPTLPSPSPTASTTDSDSSSAT